MRGSERFSDPNLEAESGMGPADRVQPTYAQRCVSTVGLEVKVANAKSGTFLSTCVSPRGNCALSR